MFHILDYGREAVVFIVTCAVVHHLLRRIARGNGKKWLPSLPSLPIVGSLPFVPAAEDMPMVFLKKAETYGRAFAFSLGSRYCIVLNGRQAIHEALVKQSLEFADRPLFCLQKIFNPHLKGFVEAQYDESFKKYHQLSISILKKFGFGKGVMETCINTEVEELLQKLRKTDGQSVSPDRMITHCVLNIISGIIFGKRYDWGDQDFEKIIENLNRFIYESMEVIPVDFCPPLRFLPSMQRRIGEVHAYEIEIMNYIEQRIAEALSSDSQNESFITSFVEAEGPNYDKEQLLFILRDLLMAGAETSSTTLKWAVLLMANHQDIQRRVQDEINSVVPRDRLPCLDDRSKLPYVEATIHEIWRNKTIVPLSLARATLSDATVEGCYVPAGTTVFVNLYSVHMDPNVWPNPSEFRPERFLDEEGRVVNKDMIMPFSVGRRSCLGEILARQEVFLFFTGLLQNFDILPPEGQDVISYTSVASVTVAPAPYNVRLIPRK